MVSGSEQARDLIFQYEWFLNGSSNNNAQPFYKFQIVVTSYEVHTFGWSRNFFLKNATNFFFFGGDFGTGFFEILES